MSNNRTIDICCYTGPLLGGWQFGVRRSQYDALGFSTDFDLIRITDDIRQSSDILLRHGDSTGELPTSAAFRYFFSHQTDNMQLAACCADGTYHCVANSPLQRQLFVERYGAPYEVHVVRNYPDWQLTPLAGAQRAGCVWLGHVTPLRAAVYEQFVDWCRGREIEPYAVTYMELPDHGWPVHRIDCVPYADLPGFLSGFEYGFGIGRCWLDLAVCGCRPVVAGPVVGPPATESNITQLMDSNCTGLRMGYGGTLAEAADAAQPVRGWLLELATPGMLLDEILGLLHATGAL